MSVMTFNTMLPVMIRSQCPAAACVSISMRKASGSSAGALPVRVTVSDSAAAGGVSVSNEST